MSGVPTIAMSASVQYPKSTPRSAASMIPRRTPRGRTGIQPGSTITSVATSAIGAATAANRIAVASRGDRAAR